MINLFNEIISLENQTLDSTFKLGLGLIGVGELLLEMVLHYLGGFRVFDDPVKHDRKFNILDDG